LHGPESKSIALERTHWLARAGDFVELTKPRLSLLAVIATLVGFQLAAADPFPLARMISTLFGACLLGGGINAVNQYLERETDALMRRTESRPLPSGRLAPQEALCFGGVLASAGVAYFTFEISPLSGLVAATIAITYLFAYTPMKRTSWTSTLVGAVPGALPVLLGWTAARADFTPGAWALFAIVFVWQLPHFFAICWCHRADYARAGCPLIPVTDRTGVRTAIQCAILCLLLVAVSLLPAWLGMSGTVYAVGAALAGIAFLVTPLLWIIRPGRRAAQRVMLASIVYLPILLALMLADRIG
jgi:protoheme IX farnesyltransferase